MSAVSPTGLRPYEPPAAVPKQTLGQGDFIRLLTTQLQTQDPLSPMDGTAFVAQLAQFSTVSGIAELNQSMARLSEQRVAALGGLIGRAVAGDEAAGTVAAVRLTADGAATLTLADGGSIALADVRSISTGDD